MGESMTKNIILKYTYIILKLYAIYLFTKRLY
jgi:hypothetical protein